MDIVLANVTSCIALIAITTIVVFMERRKEELMLLKQLQERLRQEYQMLRTYLVTAPLTAGELLNRSYEVVWKEEITTLFESMPESNCRYSDEMLLWIMKQPNSLDFLFQTWRHTDYLLTAEFANLLFDELSIRKDGMNE